MADIIIFLIIGGFTLFGFKKGLVRSVVGILSLAASVVLAWLLYPVISDILASLGIKMTLTENIQESLSGYIGGGEELAMLPQGIRTAIESGSMELVSSAAGTAAQIALNIIAFIAVLIVSRIIIQIAAKLLNIIARLPVIGLFNRAAGMLLGALQGVAVVYIILAVIYATAPMDGGTKMNSMIEESALASVMYENNPIVDVVLN